MEKEYPQLTRRLIKGEYIHEYCNGVYYRAEPSSKNEEIYTKVFLEWAGDFWVARLNGCYENKRGVGRFDEGFFRLNVDACKNLCNFYGAKIEYKNKNHFIETISKMSPLELYSLNQN